MAELYEISFALEAHRRAMEQAAAGAVQARQVQDRQARRERRVLRQDRHADVLKQARQSGDGTAEAKASVMEAQASACLSGVSRTATKRAPLPARRPAPRTAPSRLAAAAGHAFWTWLIPAAGVAAGMLAMLAVLLAACFLL